MDDFLEALGAANWKEVLRLACRINKQPMSMSSSLTINKLRLFEDRFQQSRRNLGDKICTSWLENELKAFTWAVLAYSGLHKTAIQHFSQDQWAQLSDFFAPKRTLFLKYEIKRSLLFKSQKNKDWTEAQQNLLMELVGKDGQEQGSKVVWNEVAHQLYEASHELYFRMPKHCRQRWLNYLDPSKNRGKWDVSEDRLLLISVLEKGRKWSQIASALRRTEHTVKNRFNSLLIKSQKDFPGQTRQNKLLKGVIEQLNMERDLDRQASPIHSEAKEKYEMIPEKPVFLPERGTIESIRSEAVIREERQQAEETLKKVQQIEEFAEKPEEEEQVQAEKPMEEVQQQAVQENEAVFPVPGFSPGVLLREDDIKNDCHSMAYPLISPTWGFSSNNNTPFLSPSPNGAIYFNNFRNYFDYFNYSLQIPRPVFQQPEQQEQEPKHEEN